MRKDVKLAFAVGAILISVLIVYVLVVPGADKPRDKQAVTLDEKPQPAASQAPTATPTEKPAEVAKASETTPEQKPVDATPTTKPTDPFASASDSKEDIWMMGLDRGTVPMMISAPAAPAPQGKNAKAQATTPPAMQAVTQAPVAPSTRPVTGSEVIQPAPVAGMRTHVVAKGETIAKIAEAAYGSQNYWPHIVRANPGLVAEKLRPGMTINLPPESEVKVGSSTASTVTDATAPKPDTTSPKLDTQTQYEVQSGDSLAKIAMKLYGNSNKWQAIYDLNKETIGENPAKLKQKSVLKLPEPPTQKSGT
jgi:nucleoid-associated protein YgaU